MTFTCIHTFPPVSKALSVSFNLHRTGKHRSCLLSHSRFSRTVQHIMRRKGVAMMSGRYSRLNAMVCWCALCKDIYRNIITIACSLHDLRSRYKWNGYENTPRSPHPSTEWKPHDTLQHSLGPDPICMIIKNEEKGKHTNLFLPEAA